MDSRSSRLPIFLPSSRSSYAANPSVSSSLRGSSRFYGQGMVGSNDGFPRASSPYKADLDTRSSRLLSSSRDHSSSDSRSTSWTLPSLTSSSRSRYRPWAESSVSGWNKSDSEPGYRTRSGLLNAGDTKRDNLSSTSRGWYPASTGNSVAGSTYSSNRLSFGRDAIQSDLFDSAAASSSYKPLTSRTHLEANEAGLSGLGDRRMRTPGLLSSMHRTDRSTSTFAQGARPKETAYSSSSHASSFAGGESSHGHHLSSSTFHRAAPFHDYISRTPTRYRNDSSTFWEQTRSSEPSTNVASSYSFSHDPLYSTPPARLETSIPLRPAPKVAEPEGRLSRRSLLPRLFSRDASQDSSSVCSLDEDGPSPSGESVDSGEGAGMSSVDPDVGGPEATRGTPRNPRADLTPIQETNSSGYRSGMALSRMALWREASESGNSGGGGQGDSSSASSSSFSSSSFPSTSSSSSWLPSSFHGRHPPLLSRLRGHQSRTSNPAVDEGYSHPECLLRRWDNLDDKVLLDDDDDEEEEEEEEQAEKKEEDDYEREDGECDDDEEEEGAGGLGPFCAGRLHQLADDVMPELEEMSVDFAIQSRTGLFTGLLGPGESLACVEKTDGPDQSVSRSDEEKLLKIKESLLLEDSDEEGDLCRICQMGEESSTNPLIQPCHCTGSLQYIHQECIKKWLCSKITSGTNLEALTTCELCKGELDLNIDNFDIHELFRIHAQSEYNEIVSNGLYLVLLHVCEQRFSDIFGVVDVPDIFNLVGILHEHMDNLQSPNEESDDRLLVDFSDLDDDLEDG